AVPRKRQVVERRRLGPERVGRAGARVAGKTELIDPRPGEHLRIVRSVRLMAGEAVPGRARPVIEDGGASLLGVTDQAWQLADARQCDRLPLAIMGVVAVEAGHSSAVEAMGIRLVLERRRLVEMTRRAQLAGSLGDQVLVLGK